MLERSAVTLRDLDQGQTLWRVYETIQEVDNWWEPKQSIDSLPGSSKDALGHIARQQILAFLPTNIQNVLECDDAITFEQALQTLSQEEQQAAQIWGALGTLADIADLEGQSEAARNYRYREHQAFAAFTGNRDYIERKYERLIFIFSLVTVTGDVQMQEVDEIALWMLKDMGEHITDAIERILEGERDWQLLTENLDAHEALLVLRILETLAQVITEARDRTTEQLLASLPLTIRDALERREPTAFAEALQILLTLTPEEQRTALLSILALHTRWNAVFELLDQAIALLLSGDVIRLGEIQAELAHLELERGDFRDAVQEVWAREHSGVGPAEQDMPMEQPVEVMQVLLSRLPINLTGRFRAALLLDLADAMEELPRRHPARKLGQIEAYYREALLFYQAEDRPFEIMSIQRALEDVMLEQGHSNKAVEALLAVAERFRPILVRLKSWVRQKRGANAGDRQASVIVHLRGAAELEAFITMKGDNPAHDDAIRRRVVEAQVLAIGAPAQGATDTAHLLHCTVPVGGTTIAMLPVFTGVEHVAAAVQMNPAWQSLQMLQMEGSVVLGDLEEEEWLGINPWSEREFKLPPTPSTV